MWRTSCFFLNMFPTSVVQAAFEFLANDLVLPAVRSALINEWEVRDPTPALTLAEALVTASVGDEIVQSLLMQVKHSVAVTVASVAVSIVFGIGNFIVGNRNRSLALLVL